MPDTDSPSQTPQLDVTGTEGCKVTLPTVPVPHDPEPPPASKVVIEGKKTEREQQLEKELEEAKTGRKQAETIAAHAELAVQRLKDAELRLRSTPPTAPKRKVGWTFFHGED